MHLHTIAIAYTPFKQRFGIPRQPGLVNATGRIVMQPGYNDPAMLDGLETFSHLWLTFIFHGNIDQGWKKKVHPPRLGGKEKVGVLASRSPHRPNFLGLSAVRLDDVITGNRPELIVSGIDLLDETPIVDIKPYIAYADALDNTTCGFATEAPGQTQQVEFSASSLEQIQSCENMPKFRELITDILAQDPRPAYKTQQLTERDFVMQLYDYEIRWQVDGRKTFVKSITLV